MIHSRPPILTKENNWIIGVDGLPPTVMQQGEIEIFQIWSNLPGAAWRLDIFQASDGGRWVDLYLQRWKSDVISACENSMEATRCIGKLVPLRLPSAGGFTEIVHFQLTNIIQKAFQDKNTVIYALFWTNKACLIIHHTKRLKTRLLGTKPLVQHNAPMSTRKSISPLMWKYKSSKDRSTTWQRTLNTSKQWCHYVDWM